MSSFDKSSLRNIKSIFEAKTGVELTAGKPVRRPLRMAAVIAAVAVSCLAMSAFAFNHFSSLSGDELNLRAAYSGDGVVSIQVENQSDKEISLQDYKLMRWATGEEVKTVTDDAAFQTAKIPAHSSEVLTFDLSEAYDVKALEKPLTDDHYYFVLTNNGFAFGQNWMCSVDFTSTAGQPKAAASSDTGGKALPKGIAESLKPYFAEITFDAEKRRSLNAQYKQDYTELFAGFNGKVVPSVSPVLPGNRIAEGKHLAVADPADGVTFDGSVPAGEQYLLVGQNWKSADANFKMLATETEYALVISAMLPLQQYADAASELPLFYILTYEKSAVTDENDAAFIHGQLIRFADLEKYKVYEDDKHICYEVSSILYSDLEAYTQEFVSRNGGIRYDGQVKKRVENIYQYYRENLGSLFYYR